MEIVEEYSNTLKQNNSTIEYITEVMDNIVRILNDLHYETERIEDKRLQKHIIEIAFGLIKNINSLQIKNNNLKLL